MVSSKTFKPSSSLYIMHNSTVLIGTVFEKAQYYGQTGAVNSHYATHHLARRLLTVKSHWSPFKP